MANKKKLFVALSLPGEVKDDLYSNAGRIEKFSNMKKTPPDNFHLTLVFIGETDKTKEISSILRKVKIEPFVVDFDGIGIFKKRRGDVIWEGIKENKSLMKLYENIYNELLENDIIKTDKRFIPHITLGRKFKISEIYNLEDIKNGLSEPLSFYVREFHLFESRSNNSQLIYEIIDTFSLEK